MAVPLRMGRLAAVPCMCGRLHAACCLPIARGPGLPLARVHGPGGTRAARAEPSELSLAMEGPREAPAAPLRLLGGGEGGEAGAWRVRSMRADPALPEGRWMPLSGSSTRAKARSSSAAAARLPSRWSSESDTSLPQPDAAPGRREMGRGSGGVVLVVQAWLATRPGAAPLRSA